jgi:hypothetical protein
MASRNIHMLVVASSGLYEDRTRSNTWGWGLILSVQIYFSYSRMMEYEKLKTISYICTR